MSNLVSINQNQQYERQTPIEVALQIDGEGNTNSKALYEFLELNPTQYARWCKTNIEDNAFATEGPEYWVYDIEVENLQGGRPSKVYGLSGDFAKKLAMISNSPKGDEARDYFIQVEQNAKKLANNMHPQTPAQLLVLFAQQLADQEQTLLNQQNQLAAVQTTMDEVHGQVETIKETFTKDDSIKWREQIQGNIKKIAEKTRDYQGTWAAAYEEMDKRGFSIKRRLDNRKNRMAEAGRTKTEINKLTRLDIIEEDSKAREIFTGIVRELVVARV